MRVTGGIAFRRGFRPQVKAAGPGIRINRGSKRIQQAYILLILLKGDLLAGITVFTYEQMKFFA